MSVYRKGFVLSLVAAVVIVSDAGMVAAMAPTQPLHTADMEEFLDTVIPKLMEEFYVPNATVSVVAGGEVIAAKGYGYADLDERIPVDPDKTLFRTGSTGKLFTWTAVMQLVEQGKLDLDVDVNEYLDFQIPARLVCGRGQSELEPITLTHLMTHTPGFEDYLSEIFSLSEDGILPLDRYVRERMPARVFPAGEVPAYSNYGTALAGYIVERVSGVPFVEYIEDQIFAPLGMAHSTFRQPLPHNWTDNMAKAYRYVDGEFREGKFEFVSGVPAGSMSTTASDMARFMLAHLQGGKFDGVAILDESTVAQMHSQQFTPHPRLDGMAHGFIEGTFNGRRTLLHPGGSMMFSIGFYLLPEENFGLFISYTGADHRVHTEVFHSLIERYFPSNDVTEHPPTEGMSERSREFVGEYHANRQSFTTSDKFLRLVMGQIHIDSDQEGYLLVTHLGETNRFVELEPGVYHNLREGRTQDFGGAFRTIVFGTDPKGKTLLMTDGPMSYSRASWYETSTVNFLLLLLAILLILGSLAYWGIRIVVLRIRHRRSQDPMQTSKVAKLAGWTAFTYGILVLISVLESAEAMQPDPVYGLPPSAFGQVSAWDALFNWVPLAMGIIGAAVVLFSVVVWWRGYWRALERIHYSLFAVATIVLLWLFSYWNVILL